MTEAEWLACNAEQGELLIFAEQQLKKKATRERKLRLIACACCRLVWEWFEDERSRRAIEVAELLADKRVKRKEVVAAEAAASQAVDDLATARDAAQETHGLDSPVRTRAGHLWYISLGAHAAIQTDQSMCQGAVEAAWQTSLRDIVPDEERAAHIARQCDLIRDVIGNPFRPVTFDPAWRTTDAVGVAVKMYEERDFAAMPILADALEEAGCLTADILAHCRAPGVHVRGCWLVDLVLAKE